MQKHNFVTRTIRNGKVKIFHKIFVPSNKWLEYDGRLDGQRVVFGLYWTSDEWHSDRLKDFVSLWGTKEDFNKVIITDKEFQEWLANEEGNALDLVDGYYPWTWWYVKEDYVKI